jgi:hypothetical protein
MNTFLITNEVFIIYSSNLPRKEVNENQIINIHMLVTIFFRKTKTDQNLKLRNFLSWVINIEFHRNL